MAAMAELPPEVQKLVLRAVVDGIGVRVPGFHSFSNSEKNQGTTAAFLEKEERELMALTTRNNNVYRSQGFTEDAVLLLRMAGVCRAWREILVCPDDCNHSSRFRGDRPCFRGAVQLGVAEATPIPKMMPGSFW
jgi:hypothetical protein